MNQNFLVFAGNQIETLAFHLKELLFFQKKPFLSRSIVVSSPAMKQWLMLELTKGEKQEALTGVTFFLERELFSLFEKWGNSSFISSLELKFRIEQKILEWKEAKQNEILLEPLFSYLGNDFSLPKTQKKLFFLTEELAELFSFYGRLGENLEEKWKDPQNWQEALWKELFIEEALPYLGKDISLQELPEELELHLFCLSFLPQKIVSLLEQVKSPSRKVIQYVFSPCQLFWGDFSSEEEKIRLKKYWTKRQTDLQKIQTLDAYLVEKNSLLANFGKVGKYEFLQRLERELFEVDCYEEFSEKTLLGSLQNSLLFSHMSGLEKKNQEKAFDGSVQVHEAQNPLREVEVFQQALVEFFLEGKKPSDICVFVSDMELYAPLIQRVFGGKEIPFRIFQRPFKSSFADGFLSFFEIRNSKWKKEAVFELLENSSFQKKQKFQESEIVLLRKWMEAGGVRWGIDSEHQKQFEKEGEIQSWKKGIDAILESFIFFQEKTKIFLEEDQKKTWEKWIFLFQNLKEDLCSLESEIFWTFSFSAEVLEKICEEYFFIGDEIEEQKAFAIFSSFLRNLKILGRKKPFSKISVSSLLKYLQREWSGMRLSQGETLVSGVTFVPFEEGQGFPAKIIGCLGFDESFPREKTSSSLNLLRKETFLKEDFSEGDRKKNFFLKGIFLAKEVFWLSFSGKNPLDGKKQNFSMFIRELFSYLDSFYVFPEGKGSEHLVTKQPPFSFHASFFQKEQKLFPGDFWKYRAAVSYYTKPKKEKVFFQMAKDPGERVLKRDKTIDLKDLMLLAKNPVQFYFKQKLKIFLRGDKKDQFFPTPLERYHVRKELLEGKNPIELLEEWKKFGKIPSQTLGEKWKTFLLEESFLLQEELKTLGIEKEKFFSVRFQEFCKEPLCLENGDWLLPPIPLCVDGQEVSLVGVLPKVSTQGLLFDGAAKKDSFLKGWPLFLAYQWGVKMLGGENSKICFLDGGQKEDFFLENPEKALGNYVKYFWKSLCCPSPFLLPWAEAFFREEASFLQEKIDKSWKESFDREENLYLKWVFSETQKPNAVFLFEEWAPFLKEVFQPLLETSVEDGAKR